MGAVRTPTGSAAEKLSGASFGRVWRGPDRAAGSAGTGIGSFSPTSFGFGNRRISTGEALVPHPAKVRRGNPGAMVRRRSGPRYPRLGGMDVAAVRRQNGDRSRAY